MNLVDAFNNDNFSMVSLTDAINALPYKPAKIGQMGLFVDEGINTVTAVVEEEAGILQLLFTKKRGAPAPLGQDSKRTVRSFAVPHIPLDDTILASALMGVRAFGSADVLESMSVVVNNRMVPMKQSHEVTLEHLRVGAIKGNILDADGSTVLFNLFTEFNVSQTTVTFDIDNSDTLVRSKCLDVKRAIETALGAMPYSGVHCFSGKTWFERFIEHESVRASYERFLDGRNLRNDPRDGFEYAGIMFEEYAGSVSGVQFVADEDAHFFPLGVPGLFKTYYAPADFVETVNTIGIPFYAKQELMKFGKGVELHTQSNPLPMCTIPATLVLGAIN